MSDEHDQIEPEMSENEVAFFTAYDSPKYGIAGEQLVPAFYALDAAQACAVVNKLWARGRNEEKDTDLLYMLGGFNAHFPGALADIWQEMIHENKMWPGFTFLGAPSTITEQLLALIEQQSGGRYNDLLMALAWIGDERVVGQFAAWREAPPTWQTRAIQARQLHLPAHEYAPEAGWELTSEGEKRQLYWEPSYHLIPSDPPQDARDLTPDVAQCGWCDRHLMTLLDLDLTDPRLAFLAAELPEPVPDDARLRIAHCQWCSMYTILYTDIDLHGGFTWSEDNDPIPGILDDVLDEDTATAYARLMIVGHQRTSPFEAQVSRTFGGDGFEASQVGGHPTWIQDAEYPVCPSCKQRMRIIGQIGWTDVLQESAEGITYAFLCLPCGKAAVNYQQS